MKINYYTNGEAYSETNEEVDVTQDYDFIYVSPKY